MRFTTLAALALSFGLVSAAQAASPNLITNGDFSSVSSAVSALQGTYSGAEIDPLWSYNGAVTGWYSPLSTARGAYGQAYNLYEFGGANTTTADADTRYTAAEAQRPDINFPGASPNGGAFMLLDGDPGFSGPLAQDLTGLTAGKAYDVSFYWAAGELSNRTGYVSERLHVSLDDGVTLQTHSTTPYLNTAGAGQPGSFSRWQKVNFHFVATGANETLSFLSDGAPGGNLPPIALLDGVSMVAVPEPAVWAFMVLGFGGAGALIRRRRRLAPA